MARNSGCPRELDPAETSEQKKSGTPVFAALASACRHCWHRGTVVAVGREVLTEDICSVRAVRGGNVGEMASRV